MGLLHPHIVWEDFLLYLVGTIMAQGGMIFTILMMEGCDFYCVKGVYNVFGGEVWVDFSCMLEPASFGWSVTYYSSHPTRAVYAECVECKQAFSQMSTPAEVPPLPCSCLAINLL